ncbi:uncharacterized protein SOCE26_059760 [Sorangium cellulosum]|uniref:Uncharacterized protein n=1 Tax=Sorangium cellulosum TaxID=56 RepID=A0A2L0EYZ4_SORCE|nr:hypothetical protein [Sorangium cellulosum]AUX44512.1 uncharacterized protein SOCE26_059760 [Sorangium cellulosum]
MGTQPIFARLSISPTGVIRGEITGLTQGTALVEGKYGEHLEIAPGKPPFAPLPDGVEDYHGELRGLSVHAGWVFSAWRGPSEQVDTPPSSLPDRIVNSAEGTRLWLAAVGQEEALEQLRPLQGTLVASAGRKPTSCGLHVQIAGVAALADGARAVAYYVGDPCDPVRMRGERAPPVPRFPWPKQFRVALVDPGNVARHSIALGDSIDDEEHVELARLESGATGAVLGVLRRWAKRAGGRAAATTDTWLLAVKERDMKLSTLLKLGHSDLNGPDSPANSEGSACFLDVDSKPPVELVVEGSRAGVYRLDRSAQGLKRLTGELSPELREGLAEAPCWPR